MQRPVQFKTIIGSILFFILFFLSVTLTARAAEAATLVGIEKQENPNHTRIVFRLSELSTFKADRSGQRVDLTLERVQVAADLRDLPEDETVVEILLGQKHDELLVSLLLRRPPQQVYTEAQVNPDRIVMDIYWQESGASRPAVAFRISDMPPKMAGKRAAKYQRKSPWTGRWYDFYRYYRRDWELKVPVKYSLPQLPPLIGDRESPLWSLQEHAGRGLYLSLLEAAETVTNLDDRQRYLCDLLVAEAQLRTGSVAAANARLSRLAAAPDDLAVRVGYLTSYGEALAGQPLVALLQLREVLARVRDNEVLMPFVRLLMIETALASGRDQDAVEHVNQIDEWPAAFLRVAELRRADALAGSGHRADALAIYRDLAGESGLYEAYLFSCGRAAFCAFKEEDYALAADLYRKLGEMLQGQSGEDLALFAIGASAYEAGDLAWGMIGLQRATLDKPGTEGADRAALRLIDLNVVKDGERGLAGAVAEYGELGGRSDYRAVREEAVFKRALGLYLLKEYELSVVELMDFRRDYASSPLRREVDLLLLEQLPRVVHELLKGRDDLGAVVLVEKNRKLLLSKDFDQSFLQDLASAYEKLGLYGRAGRVLLYLFDRTEGTPDQEKIYLPLARSFLKREEYVKASEYAERYLKRYPRGEDAGELFGFLLDAFERQQRGGELLEWLGDASRPRSVKLEQKAAAIYWKQGLLDDVIACLEWIRESGSDLGVKEMALLAESYYQLADNRQAEKNYRLLYDDPVYGTQARYRTAQIRLRSQDRTAALGLLEQVAGVSGEDPWGKLARDLLIQEQR